MSFNSLIRSGRFPEAVQKHLPEWCPANLTAMLGNETFDPDLLIDHVTPRTKHDAVRSLLSRATPTTYAKIVDSRERRDSVLEPLLQRVLLNGAAQLAFATKAVSENVADAFVALEWSTDEARARIALRATPAKVMVWLASGADLDDDAVIKLIMAIGEGREHNPYAGGDAESALAVLCASRPAVRTRLLHELPFVMLTPVVSSGFTPADEEIFLARLATAHTHDTTGNTTIWVGSAALTQPTLSQAGARRIFELAEANGNLRSLLQRDVWLPESGLFLGTPLEELTDTAAAARVLAQEANVFSGDKAIQFAKILAAPAVLENENLALRAAFKATTCASRKSYYQALVYPALEQMQQAARFDTARMGSWQSSVANWRSAQREQDRTRASVASSEQYVTVRHRRVTEAWWHNDNRPFDERALGALALENVRAPEGHFDVSRYLTSIFGDGTDERSLALWRTAMLMFPKHKGTLRQLVTTVQNLQD